MAGERLRRPAQVATTVPAVPAQDKFERYRRALAGTPTAPSPGRTALEVEAGRLTHRIPDKMWLGVEEVVEVRLGRAAATGLATGLLGSGKLTSEELPIVESMSVVLQAAPGAFEIEARAPDQQLVKRDVLAGTGLEGNDFGRWIWHVTPRKLGAQQLVVQVSATVRDSRGVPASVALPDKSFPVAVAVSVRSSASRFVKWAVPGLTLAVLTGIVGGFTRDYWWPALSELLKSWGWLG